MNRLEQQKLNNLVFVKYNGALKRRYKLCNLIDLICCKILIDAMNGWLKVLIKIVKIMRMIMFFSEEDRSTYEDVKIASGARESRYSTRW